MSQEELARFIYRTRVTVSDMERGRVRVSTQDLALIGAGLEKPITHFSAVLTAAEGGQLTPEEKKPIRKMQCNSCGSDRYEERRIEYLYGHEGKYLVVPNTPVEICLNCGMICYDAAVLKEIEQHFLAIQNRTEQPDCYVEMPARAYA